jgi:hypothetical protein
VRLLAQYHQKVAGLPISGVFEHARVDCDLGGGGAGREGGGHYKDRDQDEERKTETGHGVLPFCRRLAALLVSIGLIAVVGKCMLIIAPFFLLSVAPLL